MAFVPLADSGVSYVLDGSTDVELVGSAVLTTVDGVAFDPDWSILLGDGSVDYNIRITPLPYTSIGQGFGEGPSSFRFTRVDTSTGDVVNGDDGETADEFIPNPVTGTGRKIDYIPGTGTETSRNESWQMLVEIEEVEPAADTCKELGRTTRAFVSGYTLDRVQVVRAARTQRRCLVADFNGAIPVGRQITSVTWRCNSPWITILDTPSISANGRAAQVNAILGNCGFGHVKCSVTLDNGEIYTQVFEVRVVDAPYFAEPYQAPGPYELTVTA
jgi:hypothetical protein